MPSLISEEEINAMYLGNESDAEPMSTQMLEDIHDSSQSHQSIYRREALYKIFYRIKQSQEECKGAIFSTRNMVKGLHKVFKTIVNEISQY